MKCLPLCKLRSYFLQMLHLVDSVLQYINDRVVAAGAWLEQVRGAAWHACAPTRRC